MTKAIRTFHWAVTRGMTVIYYFPDDGAMYTFVQGRIDPLIDRNPYLASFVKQTNNKTLKMVGLAMTYFFGMKGKTQKESTAADILVFDEFDLMNPLDVEIALNRVEASEFKFKHFSGNPTIPDFGIHAKFLESDQKHWAMKCQHCGLQNIYLDDLRFDPSWVEQGFLACKKCRLKVDTTAGEWVPAYPGRKISGRQISRLFAKNADYGKIYADSRRPIFTQNFYNRTLGLPWTDTQTRITKEHVLKMCGAFPMPELAYNTTAGIDVNPVAGHHIVISKPGTNKLREIIHMGVYPSLDDLPQVMRKFDVKKFVIDAQPDKEGAVKLCRLFRGKGWICYYHESKKGPYEWNEDDRVVTVDRTESLDSSQRLLRDSLLGLPRRVAVVEDFAEQCANIARVLEKDERTGTVKARWIELGVGKPDHFRHALNYDAIAWAYHGQGAPTAEQGFRTPPNIRELLQKERHR